MTGALGRRLETNAFWRFRPVPFQRIKLVSSIVKVMRMGHCYVIAVAIELARIIDVFALR
jgi:hypothetical protein